MSKKKGLSLEDKRQKIMEIFHEKKEFFQLKELESIAKKEKGLNPMQVKELVQSLVDDDMVDTEKIGVSSHYWSFPSKYSETQKRKLASLEEKEKQLLEKEESLKEDITQAKVGKEDSEEKAKIIKEIEEKENIVSKLEKELQELKEHDPAEIERKRGDIKMAVDGTNRWTDNIFSIKSWCKSKLGIDETQINQAFDIPEDLDYIDPEP